MAREFLVELGIISRDEAIAAVNSDLRALADSPHRAWPYARLREYVEDRGYSQSVMKFNYYRGALMAARWDWELEQRGDVSLADLLRSMIHEAMAGNGRLTERRFFEIGAAHGLAVKADFEHFVVRGEPIPMPAGYASPEYERTIVQLPRFDLGFDLVATWREGAVKDVRPAGPAYRAGLRDGMPFVRSENTTRDSNTWEATAPAVVVVRENGRERAIEYFPAGEYRPVTQYVRR